MKKIIIIIIVLVAVLGGVFLYFTYGGEEELELGEVKRGIIIKEISETGAVEISKKADLSFKNMGRIESIRVEEGDTVKKDSLLAEQNKTNLFLQLEEARRNLEVIRAEEGNVGVSLESARQNLADVEAEAEEDLENAYEDGFNVLKDVYLELYDTYNLTSYFTRTYFSGADNQEALEVKYQIKYYYGNLEDLIESIEEEYSREAVDSALLEVKEKLDSTIDKLEDIRDLTENSANEDKVSSTDKDDLDAKISSVNSEYGDVVSAIQTISSTKVDNQKAISTARSQVSEIENKLTEEGNGLYQARVKEAQAKISLLENEIQEASLRSPSEGQITEVQKETGEIVQAGETVFSFLPSAPFQIKVDIYEGDIIDVEVGDPVRISLVAFEDKIVGGEVLSVNPAEKVVDDVVYYETTIGFKESIEGIKPGMTADIVIETNKKEDVILVPEEAVDESKVRVFQSGEIEEREIETGIEGDDFIEVITGLEEGEKVVLD